MSFYVKYREWRNDIHLAAAYYALGRIWPEELLGIAVEALTQGYDSRSLRILAGETDATSHEVYQRFKKVLDELDIPLPDEKTAMHQVARYRAHQIVSKELHPYVGASLLLEEIDHSNDLGLECIKRIIGEVYEYEDFMERRGMTFTGKERQYQVLGEIEESIVNLAQRVLNEVQE